MVSIFRLSKPKIVAFYCCRHFGGQDFIALNKKLVLLPSPACLSSLSTRRYYDRTFLRTYSSSQPSSSGLGGSKDSSHSYVIKEKKIFDDRLGVSRKEKKHLRALLFSSLAVVGGILLWVYRDKVRSWFSGHAASETSGKPTKGPIKRIYYSLDGPEYMDSYVPPLKENRIVLPSPRKYAKLPDRVKYLIIGSGAAGFAAFRAIRGYDAEAKVLVIGEEDHLPYMRPPLSKEMWFTDERKVVEDLKFQQWTGKERSIFYEKDAFYCDPMTLNEKPHGGVSVVSGRKVLKLDVLKHEAILDDGSKIKYEKCLIATGGSPKMVKEIAEGGSDVLKHVTIYRRLEDFSKLDELLRRVKSVAIVGGGFLGTELACALSHKAKGKSLNVTQLFPEPGNLSKILPEYLCKWTTDRIRKEGVNVLTDATVQRATCESNQVKLQLTDGRTVHADHVIIAVGINPNVELAKTSGLEVDPEIGGFRCDAELRARSDVWVAGDCCSFYDPQLGRRRVEHQDHAVVSGRLAGENMAGANKPYQHQSMFWSDIGPNLGLEALGLIDSSLPTVGVFAKAGGSESSANGSASETLYSDEGTPSDFDKGVVFYVREQKIVGILLWNLYSRISIARRVLKEDVVFDDLDEVAKLFNIHDAPPVTPAKE